MESPAKRGMCSQLKGPSLGIWVCKQATQLVIGILGGVVRGPEQDE